MKKIIAASLLAASLGTPALAADMAVKAAPIVVNPAYNWTGFYVGVDAGGEFSGARKSFSQRAGAPFDPVQFSAMDLGRGNQAGLVAGLHAGYNWQATPNFVLGVEGDFSWASETRHSSTRQVTRTDTGALVPNNFVEMADRVQWLASIRGRAGVSFDNLLLYGTGGVAFTDITFEGRVISPGAVSSIHATAGGTQTGWVAGGGLEWAPGKSNWLVRAEYLYYGFKSQALVSGCPACAAAAFDGPGTFAFNDVNYQVGRVGLSYKFGQPAPAVVAKY